MAVHNTVQTPSVKLCQFQLSSTQTRSHNDSIHMQKPRKV